MLKREWSKAEHPGTARKPGEEAARAKGGQGRWTTSPESQLAGHIGRRSRSLPKVWNNGWALNFYAKPGPKGLAFV